jgi:uncharacterized protein YbbC (DUF1343 family)
MTEARMALRAGGVVLIALVPLIAPAAPGQAAAQVRPGIEVLLADPPASVVGRRVGLITNRSGVDRAGRRTVDLLAARPELELVALFAFEHGLGGTAPPGARIADAIDAATGLPVHSLYGEVRRPTPAMLAGIDVLVYDAQDSGARPYTRVSTMALAMAAAAEAGIPFVVLDRPNPLGGVVMEGPVLEPAFASFVGMYPIPLRHGMTVGELARLYNDAFGIGAELVVVPAEGWRRRDRFDATGLAWVPPSPNLPRLEAAAHYPGTVLVEGTTLSEGRGTAHPFEQVGAPWLRPAEVVRALAPLALPGVAFHVVTLAVAPGTPKHGGQRLPGIRLVITDPDAYRPVATVLHLLAAIRALHPDDFAWTATIDRLAGTERVRAAIEAGSVAELLAEEEQAVAAFAALREPYLLYR